MESETIGGNIVRTDAQGTGTSWHIMYIEVVNIPRFGGTTSRDNTQRNTGIYRSI